MLLRQAIVVLLLALPLAAAEPTVKLRVHTPRGESTVDLPLERYVATVVAGEGGVLRSDAARQALAVAARTYAVRLQGRHSAEGFDFCDTTHCQRADLNAVTPAIAATTAQTAGELVWFEGSPAFTPYSRDCGGRTEDAAEVWSDQAAPYLRSQADPYCLRAGSRPWQWNRHRWWPHWSARDCARRTRLSAWKSLSARRRAGRRHCGSRGRENPFA
jgi:stage II sporulation protein D